MDLSVRSHTTRGRGGSSSSSNNNNHHNNNNTRTNDQAAAAAAASLQLLLREDPLLIQYGLTTTTTTSSSSSSSSTDEVAFPYAAALLRQENDNDNNTSSTTTTTTTTTDAAVAKQRADMALQDVERKLALVESLAVKLSRTSPEAVAGPLLRLHGYHVGTAVGTAAVGKGAAQGDDNKDETEKQQQQHQQQESITTDSTASTSAATLTTIRDRADRLERQAESIQAVARRVEGSLTRSLTRMQTACTRLERVLQLTHALKTCMRWQFEFSKLQSADLEGDNVRDLTAAAASVAVLQEAENTTTTTTIAGTSAISGIHVLDELRPAAAAMATAVRQAAANLLFQSSSSLSSSSSSSAAANGASLSQLGATLQVYYHLGELPEAVWKAVQDAHQQALAASRQLWNPVTLLNITEQAKRQQLPKDSTSSIGSSGGGGGGGISGQRAMQKKLKLARAEAAQKWAAGLEQAVQQVRNLEQVLRRKTDPIKRQVYMDVVAAAPIPTEYASTTKQNKSSSSKTVSHFSLFQLFWGHLCQSLAEAIESVLKYENGKLRADVAGLYPAVRASSLELLGRLQEASSAVHAVSLSSSIASSALDEAATASSSSSTGILGGSFALEDPFLQWTTTGDTLKENPQAATSADSWTRPQGEAGGLPTRKTALSAMALRNAILSSQEWLELQGTSRNHSGLYPLEQAFLTSCRERLQEPLQYMFPGHDTMLDEDGAVIGTTNALLPSKYDLQRFDENIRQELSLADPREGGGDLSAVVMIAECVVDMLSDFCLRAKNALSGVGGEQGYTVDDAWNMTESLQHDRKVVAILYTLKGYLRQAPEKTFVAPYRPTTLPQHEEAAHLCQVALMPAIDMIDRTVKSAVLNPVCRSLNRKIASVLAKMHLGVYLEGNSSFGDDEASPAFVQKHLVPVFDLISKNFTSRFPPPYAAVVTSTVATYTLYSFVSNASLIRPLGESARLHITQDLADLELMLDQFVGGTLSQMEGGRPYAELRAVRQMLFWSGLETKNTPATEVAKSLLREGWIKDVRPSTVFQYLFSFAPNLLSSPHHAKRLRAEDYVSTCLVMLDGSVESGEDDSWMTTMACCDAYQQRAAATRVTDGDPRIAEILMALGQELLRRRRR